MMNRVAIVPPALPVGLLTVADRSLSEGDSGSTNMTFTLSLAFAQSRDVRVFYCTRPGTATPGVDYTPVSGHKVITAGQLTATVDVPILGDTTDEDDETFFVDFIGAHYV